MKDFNGKIAVITGGGTGMGRELARQLVAEGCSVAMCDVSAKNMAETVRLIEADGRPQGAKVTTHLADVSLEAALIEFREELKVAQETDHIHLLFNNAGIAGGGSMVTDSRAAWEKTFNVCWGGVYLGVRTFLPMLMNADEGHIINTSSVNGFWGTIGPNVSHTSYAAAKFAVKGFTEALVTDLRLTAPHIKCSVVMPGHIGTAIITNSRKIQAGNDTDEMSADELAAVRANATAAGTDMSQVPDAMIAAMVAERARSFQEDAPMSAAAAAKVILDGVKAERWRILVGDDAVMLDQWVRKDPELAYEPQFYQDFVKEVGWKIGG